MRNLGCLFLFISMIFIPLALLPLLFINNESMQWMRDIQASVFCNPGEVIVNETARFSYMGPGEQRVYTYCFNEETDTLTDIDGQLIVFYVVGFVGFLLFGLTLFIVGMKRSIAKHVNNLGMSNLSGASRTAVTINGQQVNSLPPDVANKFRRAGLGGLIDNINAGIEQSSSANIGGAGFSGVSFGGASGGTGSQSLTDQLKDLEQAYEKRLISKDEYDMMRQRIISGG